jgi:hypothetical protein
MIQIELTQSEANMLRDILKKHLSELSFEIAFTHRRDFVEFLEKRKEFIETLVQRLERELTPGERSQLKKADFLQGFQERQKT